MQFRQVAVAAAFIGLAQAQNVVDQCIDSALAIDPCATSCIASQGEAMGCTGELDFNCECSHLVEIAAACAVPVLASCGFSFINVLGSANALCSCVTSVNMEATNTDATTTSEESSSAPTGGISVPTGGISVPTSGVSIPTSGVSLPTSGLSSPSISARSSSGSSTRISITPLPGTDSFTHGGSATEGGAPVASVSRSSMQLSHFTGAGATISAFVPVGGIMGAVLGMLAYL